jgi:excisionase family DNA binding protein
MPFVDVKAVARFLAVKEPTLYQWAELGQIPCYKINGCVRFNLEEIEEWVKSCKKDRLSDYNPLLKLEARKGGKN